jgi:hypothetical protein
MQSANFCDETSRSPVTDNLLSREQTASIFEICCEDYGGVPIENRNCHLSDYKGYIL